MRQQRLGNHPERTLERVPNHLVTAAPALGHGLMPSASSATLSPNRCSTSSMVRSSRSLQTVIWEAKRPGPVHRLLLAHSDVPLDWDHHLTSQSGYDTTERMTDVGCWLSRWATGPIQGVWRFSR